MGHLRPAADGGGIATVDQRDAAAVRPGMLHEGDNAAAAEQRFART